MLTLIEEIHSAVFLPQLDLFLSSWNTANLFSLERRKERRKAFLVRAKLDLSGEFRRGRGKNISTSGLSLSVENPPPISILQTICICLVNESFYFCLCGKVRGIREMERHPDENPSIPIVNLAIEFINIPEREKRILDSLIEGYQERSVSFHLEASISKEVLNQNSFSPNSYIDLLCLEDYFDQTPSNKENFTSVRSSQLLLPI